MSRAVAQNWSYIPKISKGKPTLLTHFQAIVLARCSLGLNPYKEHGPPSQVTQAIGRLKRWGFMEENSERLTPAGDAALLQTFAWFLNTRHWWGQPRRRNPTFGPSYANKQAALHHWIKMHARKKKKGYLDFYYNELGVDEALIALDLAKRVSWGRGVSYADAWGGAPRP